MKQNELQQTFAKVTRVAAFLSMVKNFNFSGSP